MRKLFFLGGLLLTFLSSVPQLVFARAPAMDSAMVKNGKIYVVVAVLVVIFIGIVLFLWRMEKKLKKLEQQENKA